MDKAAIFGVFLRKHYQKQTIFVDSVKSPVIFKSILIIPVPHLRLNNVTVITGAKVP